MTHVNPTSTPDVTSPSTLTSVRDSTNPGRVTHINPTSTPDVTSPSTLTSVRKSTNQGRVTHINPTSTPDVTSPTTPTSVRDSTNPGRVTHINPTSTPDVTSPSTLTSVRDSTNPGRVTHINPTSTTDVTSPTIPTSVRDSTNPGRMTHMTTTGTHDVTSRTPETLNKPVLDLDVTAVNDQIYNSRFVAALPEEEAAVVNEYSQVEKINETGHTIKELFNCQSCDNIRGLLLLGSNLYVILVNGTIVEIQPHTGELLNVYHIPDAGGIDHYGSLWSDPSKIPKTGSLLLPNWNTGEVFSYNLTSKHKQVLLTGLSFPTSVSYSFYNINSTHYIVCQYGHHTISIYNSSWDLVSLFGGYGSSDGYLNRPYAAIMSYNNTILVSDYYNNRISVFTTDGVFLYHLLTQSDGIYHPRALSYYKRYLWVVNNGKLYRYRMSE